MLYNYRPLVVIITAVYCVFALIFVSRFNLLTFCRPEYAFQSDKVELVSQWNHIEGSKSTDRNCAVEM